MSHVPSPYGELHLLPAAAEAWNPMRAEALSAYGTDIYPGGPLSAYRTYGQQAELYEFGTVGVRQRIPAVPPPSPNPVSLKPPPPLPPPGRGVGAGVSQHGGLVVPGLYDRSRRASYHTSLGSWKGGLTGLRRLLQSPLSTRSTFEVRALDTGGMSGSSGTGSPGQPSTPGSDGR